MLQQSYGATFSRKEYNEDRSCRRNKVCTYMHTVNISHRGVSGIYPWAEADPELALITCLLTMILGPMSSTESCNGSSLKKH